MRQSLTPPLALAEIKIHQLLACTSYDNRAASPATAHDRIHKVAPLALRGRRRHCGTIRAAPGSGKHSRRGGGAGGRGGGRALQESSVASFQVVVLVVTDQTIHVLIRAANDGGTSRHLDMLHAPIDLLLLDNSVYATAHAEKGPEV